MFNAKRSCFLLSLLLKMLVGLCLCLSLTACITQATLERELSKTPQNNLLFVDQLDAFATKTLLSPEALKKRYLKHFYAPWQNEYYVHIYQIVVHKALHLVMKDIAIAPGWNANQHIHTQQFVQSVVANMDLDNNYPNVAKRAITVRSTNLRALPTDAPSFADWYEAGKGYPFDNWQAALLSVNTPLYVLHTTRDGEWSLVLTPYRSFGWVRNLDFAYLSAAQVSKLSGASDYAVILNNDESVYDAAGHYVAKTKIGTLFPLASKSSVKSDDKQRQDYRAYMVYRNFDGSGMIKKILLRSDIAARWPLVVNLRNIATLANHFIDYPFGFGGVYGYGDCSKLPVSLFAPFAIWLPAVSELQSEEGESIDLSGMSHKEKQALIIKKGVPFLTLLWTNGHVMLYVGHRAGTVYVLHNSWGLRTKNYLTNKNGRVVIGRVAITPINLGHGRFNVTRIYLDWAQKMILLTDRKSEHDKLDVGF